MMNEAVNQDQTTKVQRVERINALLHECNDIPLLDLIEKLLIDRF